MMEQSTEKRQELLYKIMMMSTILQQDIDPNNHKKTPILSKTTKKQRGLREYKSYCCGT